MTKRITKQQYWQVTGLLALAKNARERMEDIESSLRSVLEVQKTDEGKGGVGDPQHIGDAIYSSYSTDTLLEKLGIAPFVDRGHRPHKAKTR